MVVPSLNRPRQATLDPLSVLALLEDEEKFKLGGDVDGRNLTIFTVNYQPNGAVQVGRPRGWPPDPLTRSADP
ncbi:hypothetical protein U9M48_031173 [Paspalum notatum var. saurae]|uniref:Uncharacterized protein n=1 Tax=Paspalum notatum var. saurae TaxID=547442 RepID=A0AAQ3X426_PASNO